MRQINRLTNVGSKAKSDDKSNNSPVRQADCMNNFRISFIRIRALLRLFFCPSRIYPPHYLIESDLRYGNSAPWEWVLRNREGRSNTAILRVSNCSSISVRLANLPKFIEITSRGSLAHSRANSKITCIRILKSWSSLPNLNINKY
jgi:hypothetical protein